MKHIRPQIEILFLICSRVPNKQGGENKRGGLEMVRYNNNRGVGIIGGGGALRN